MRSLPGQAKLATSAGAAARRRGLALAVLCAATLMIILDGTVVTVALPPIQRGLSFRAADLSWVMDAYLIAFAGLLLLAGRLGDLAGRKRVFLAGLALFAIASLACGLAASPGELIAARFAQGAGGAMVTAVSLGMIADLYPEPGERARAVAAYSFTGAVGASAGLVLGGALTQALGWRWAFFINLPVAALAGWPAVRLLRAEPGLGVRAGADWLGALLVTSGLMAGIAAVVQGPAWLAGVAAAALAGFWLRQARVAAPLLPPRIVRSRVAAVANLSQILVIAAAFGFQVVIAIYLQRRLGYGPAAAGLSLAPTAVVIGAVSLGLSARLITRYGGRRVLLAGLALIAVALCGVAAVTATGSGRHPLILLPWLLIFGAGGGLSLPALAIFGMSVATPEDAGVVSGLFNTTQQAGAALGVALLTTLAGTAAGGPSRYWAAFAAGAALTAIAAALTALLPGHGTGTSRQPGPSAGRPAERAGARSPDQASE